MRRAPAAPPKEVKARVRRPERAHARSRRRRARRASVGRSASAPIKYADLSNDLVRDYVFDMDRMIAFDGQHRPVSPVRPRPDLLHLRARRIGRCRKAACAVVIDAPFRIIREPAEKAVALMLLRKYGGGRSTDVDPHARAAPAVRLSVRSGERPTARFYKDRVRSCKAPDDPATRVRAAKTLRSRPSCAWTTVSGSSVSRLRTRM